MSACHHAGSGAGLAGAGLGVGDEGAPLASGAAPNVTGAAPPGGGREGEGYIMYSQRPASDRFGSPPAGGAGAEHFVAVALDEETGRWRRARATSWARTRRPSGSSPTRTRTTACA